uniref:valine--tRNA ligase n=1 Tax=Panagrolaimus davidi TaxID=227884 RepID=A0A914QRJ0_9BILA
MPFITEELWQRIPKRPSVKAISIHVSEFPEAQSYPFHDEKLEERINLAIEILKRVRSTRTEHKLLPKTKTDIFIVVADAERDLLKDTTQFIATLASSNNARILSTNETSSIPNGCAEVNISETCNVSIALS